MPVLKFNEVPAVNIRDGVERKLIHTNELMMTLVDFTGGPWGRPDPLHSHPHEQLTFVATGEFMVFIDGEEQYISQGDMFAVPSGFQHTVQLLSKEGRLVDAFHPLREDFLK